MCSLLASLNIHAAFVVFQLSLVTLSQHASGLHLITAARVTGWWQLRSSTEMHMLGRCQWRTTHWEAPTVTVLQWCIAGPGNMFYPLTFLVISTDTLSFHLGTVAAWFPGLVLLWNCQQTDKPEMLFLFFIATGHFLLLNPSPVEKRAGICKYHLTSPVLPGSDKRCIFQLALYEAAPAAGNLTLLIKAVLSGSTVRTLSLNHTSRVDHRLAITEIVLICMFVQQYGTVSVYCQ